MMRKLLLLLLVAALPLTAFAEPKAVVGSKIDTEGALLGNMIILVLEEHGFETVDKTELGPTNIIRKAIKTGQIDIYPEYTGNGGFFFDHINKNVFKNADEGYKAVKKADHEKNGLVWMTPAPANNTWAIASRKDLAEEHNLESLEDLARYMNNGGEVKLAASEEFASRPDTLKAFQKVYGFEFSGDELLLLSGGNTAQTEQAAAQRINGVNLAMAYGTDGALAALGLVVLKDTKGVQPVYEPAPVATEEFYKKYPEVEDYLAPVFKSLNGETLQRLNASIALEGRGSKQVAEEYLKSKGFIK
ncbi:glycine betaine ABC transporter substrate-binding protein OsmF [Limisalsivibrio acetivorans]|uniref:glycine betaine ABC transporter substrate-binding protein OsmF n=1 Tax=Limisalsivibrio acetivorans TaxID=1304888 RepID=UPI0003B41DA4|nr:ABC transporter substrate-binding protein [Limisalsivibrio acetivorans]